MASKLDPREIAFWRYELLLEALDESLQPSVRGQLLRQLSKTPVRWPSGRTKGISLATLYRWLERFGEGGLEALQPRPRRDRGKRRRRLPDEVVREALAMLSEDPEVTYTFLLKVLEAKFHYKKLELTRSTLQRRLAAQPAYAQIKRARKQQRRRTRFVDRAPHDIWQTDAKGPVTIRLASGRKLAFHILSILDDATRAILAAIVVRTVNLAAVVLVFCMAALRWGLPKQLYADRASVFDSKAFRRGLAQLGSHRIPTIPRNAEARGKIEAYHRVLVLWFTKRLRTQRVVDLTHLQQLLDGIIAALYQPHRHRGLKCSPEKALAGTVSARAIAPTRLYEAFRQERRLKAHPKTGEVDIEQTCYLVPDRLRGQRLTFLLDPPGRIPPLVVDPVSGQHLRLRRAAIKPDDLEEASSTSVEPERWGAGPLQAIYDHWHGTPRPQAEPGFGLPEVYALLTGLAGRHVPRSDAEAARVQRIYRDIGPLPRIATEAAMAAIGAELGPGRPIKTYLEAFIARVRASCETDPPGSLPS